jgi:hypothetical protein
MKKQKHIPALPVAAIAALAYIALYILIFRDFILHQDSRLADVGLKIIGAPWSTAIERNFSWNFFAFDVLPALINLCIIFFGCLWLGSVSFHRRHPAPSHHAEMLWRKFNAGFWILAVLSLHLWINNWNAPYSFIPNLIDVMAWMIYLGVAGYLFTKKDSWFLLGLFGLWPVFGLPLAGYLAIWMVKNNLLAQSPSRA